MLLCLWHYGSIVKVLTLSSDFDTKLILKLKVGEYKSNIYRLILISYYLEYKPLALMCIVIKRLKYGKENHSIFLSGLVER